MFHILSQRIHNHPKQTVAFPIHEVKFSYCGVRALVHLEGAAGGVSQSRWR